MFLKTDFLALGLLTLAVGYLVYLTRQKKALTVGLVFAAVCLALWVMVVYSYLSQQG